MSTINASGAGIVYVSDNTASLILQTNGNDAISINSSQQVTFSSSLTLSLGSSITTSQVIRSGSVSAPAWTTNGIAHQTSGSSTFTDTSSTGTVAVTTINTFNQHTLASSNSVNVTDAATLYIAGAPIAGNNTTITNSNACLLYTSQSPRD
mgnify:CR=1 FL=1